jgi:hypothetical protein
MYSFLVGGYLPGTNIQLSFQAYLAIMTLLGGSGAVVWIELKRHLLGQAVFVRQPLHASRLHHRG